MQGGSRTGEASQVTGSLTVATRIIRFSTGGHADIINITGEIHRLLGDSGLRAGSAVIFAPGATGAVTTLEFEPGVTHDFRRLFDEIAPAGRDYEHNARLGDGNGHAHVRAGLLGPSLAIPFTEGHLLLGRWQEVCFVCFDTRPRERRVVIQFIGV